MTAATRGRQGPSSGGSWLSGRRGGRRRSAQAACLFRGQSRAHTPRAGPQTPRLCPLVQMCAPFPVARPCSRLRAPTPALLRAAGGRLVSAGHIRCHQGCVYWIRDALWAEGARLQGWVEEADVRFGGDICCTQNWELTQESGFKVKCWTISWSKGQPQSGAGQAFFSQTLR